MLIPVPCSVPIDFGRSNSGAIATDWRLQFAASRMGRTVRNIGGCSLDWLRCACFVIFTPLKMVVGRRLMMMVDLRHDARSWRRRQGEGSVPKFVANLQSIHLRELLLAVHRCQNRCHVTKGEGQRNGHCPPTGARRSETRNAQHQTCASLQ